jgi:hypothetical protein
MRRTIGAVTAALATIAFAGIARSASVDVSVTWKGAHGLPEYCKDAKDIRFTVQPGEWLAVKLTLSRYISAGKGAYVPLALAFSCVRLYLDDGKIVAMQPDLDTDRVFGYTRGRVVYSPDQMLLSREPAMAEWDEP